MRRWGSCDSTDPAANWRIIQAPPMLIDDVIAHELAYQIHVNHSADL